MSLINLLLRAKKIRRNFENSVRKNLEDLRKEFEKNPISLGDDIFGIKSEIGRGGFSSVYLIKGNTFGKKFALKVTVTPDWEHKERLRNEVEILKELSRCSRVIDIIDYEICNKFVYMVLELAEDNLYNVIRNNRNQWVDLQGKLMDFWAEILKGVYQVHNMGLIHMDLKMENFVIVKGKLKIIDFGISIRLPENSVETDVKVNFGTEGYCAPECYETKTVTKENGEDCHVSTISQKCDVWSIGIMLLQMLEPNLENISIGVELNVKKIIKANKAAKMLRVSAESCLKRNPHKRATLTELIGLRKGTLDYHYFKRRLKRTFVP